MISAGGSFQAPFMVSALTVAIPTIGVEFKMDAVAMSWLTTVFFLAASMFLIPFGRLADIFGVKKIFSIGIGIYFVSGLLAALAPNAVVLIFARFVTGLGAAMIFGTSFALLSLSLSERERGEALGLNIAANLTGFALGFFLGGLLTYYLSWRFIFFSILPISALVLVLIRLRLPGECAFSKGQKFDIVGSAMIAGLLFLIIRGLSELPSLRGGFLIIGGIVVLLLFILWQSKINQPVLDLSLFRNNRCFSLSNAAIMIYTTSTLAVIFLFSFYLQYIKGFDSRSAGLILLTPTLIMAALAIHVGRLSDRMNLYYLASIGIVISLIGLVLMTFISPNTPLLLAIMEIVLIFSVGGAFFYPPLVKIILGSISRDSHALGSSLAETMRLIGNASSMALVTVGFTLYLGGTDITPDNYTKFLQSMKLILAAFSVLCMISLILIRLAKRAKIHEKR
ncbi:MAG: MFS transporter [Methanotrichaceae archaeon]|nr:MFS transporter [Methanotrichaceae archaeon]